MQYRKLGATGLYLSKIGFGSWATIGERFTNKQSLDLLSMAYDNGINYFDTAETYADGKTEQALGDLLKVLGWPREKFVISAKVFWGTHQRFPNTWGLSRKHIFDGCEASLKRLDVDYIDLFLCHRHDPNTSIEEVVTSMNHLISQGKILYWGTSEWSSHQFRQAYDFAKKCHFHPPVLEQLEYNLFNKRKVEDDFLDLYANAGIGLTTWSPLKSGLLAGKYLNSIPENSRLGDKQNAWLYQEIFGNEPETRKLIIHQLQKLIFDEMGMSLKEFALTWCLRNKNVTSVITSASKRLHLEEAVHIANADVELSSDLLKKVNNILCLKEVELCK